MKGIEYVLVSKTRIFRKITNKGALVQHRFFIRCKLRRLIKVLLVGQCAWEVLEVTHYAVDDEHVDLSTVWKSKNKEISGQMLYLSGGDWNVSNNIIFKIREVRNY